MGHDVIIAHSIKDSQPADFCFCLSFGQILPTSVRSQFKHTLVVHGSDLPQGRGWAPMAWQLLEGKNRIPVTLFEAADAVDAGPIYLQEWIALNGTELNHEWRRLQAEAINCLCVQWVGEYPEILNKARMQTGEPSFYPRRKPEHSHLDATKTIAEQFDLLRVVDNERYPAYFEIRGNRYSIRIEEGEDNDRSH